MSWSTTSLGTRYSYIRKNNDDNERYGMQASAPSPLFDPTMHSSSVQILMDKDDYIELSTWQNSGSSLNININDAYGQTNMSIEMCY